MVSSSNVWSLVTILLLLDVCIIIGDGNSKHYLLASQDIDIQQRLREINSWCVCVGGGAVYMYMHTCERTYVHIHIMFNFHSGVPLVYIVRNTLVPESLSEMSYSEADKVNICMYAYVVSTVLPFVCFVEYCCGCCPCVHSMISHLLHT